MHVFYQVSQMELIGVHLDYIVAGPDLLPDRYLLVTLLVARQQQPVKDYYGHSLNTAHRERAIHCITLTNVLLLKKANSHTYIN